MEADPTFSPFVGQPEIDQPFLFQDDPPQQAPIAASRTISRDEEMIQQIEALTLYIVAELKDMMTISQQHENIINSLELSFQPIARNSAFDAATGHHIHFSHPHDEVAEENEVKTTTTRITFPSNRGHQKKFAQLFKTLSMIHSALINDQQLTKREIYYSDPTLFGTSQATSDQTIDLICSILCCTRERLHIVAAARGMICGPITFSVDQNHVDCAVPTSITPFVYKVAGLQGQPEFVLIVEKETVFRRLCDADFPALRRCILVTGKGYPCLSTRQMLRALVGRFTPIPCFCLVDADVHGLRIYSTYKFGNAQRSLENVALPIVQFLGVSLADLESLGILQANSAPLTDKDKRSIDTMLQDWGAQDTDLSRELMLLQSKNLKAEVEAIVTVSANYLTDVYLPDKIRYLSSHHMDINAHSAVVSILQHPVPHSSSSENINSILDSPPPLPSVEAPNDQAHA